ncbi:Uncharacterised protein [Mycobacteroides abscessus subsp. abscessus]|nr:Uncharacterised protein [Mycobacteroides abscessus subsp. abscessus]
MAARSAACMISVDSDTLSPCNAWTNVSDSEFTWSGCSTENSGSNPDNNADTSKDGSVRSTGMCPPGASGSPSPSPGTSAM